MPARPVSDRALRQRAKEVLGLGTVTVDDLVAHLGGLGIELGRDPAERVGLVLDGDSAFIELEGGWASASALLDGTTWCTNLPDDAAADGILPTEPDLALLGWLTIDETLRLARPDGSYDELDSDEDVLLGPDGWLDGLGGSTVGVRLSGDTVHVAPVDAAAPTAAMVGALTQAFERHARHDTMTLTVPTEEVVELTNIELDDVLWEALIADRAAFVAGAIPPVDDLLAAAGLERDGHVVARRGFDWEAFERLYRRRRLSGVHDVPDGFVDYAEVVLGASRAVIAEGVDGLGPPDERAALALLVAAGLTHPAVAMAVLDEHLARGRAPEDLVRFAGVITGHVDDAVAAGARWLAARAADLMGDPDRAEHELEQAAEHEHPPAMAALAAFKADRGDAAAALSLLRRAEVDSDDGLLAEVLPYALTRPKAKAGRNDPCPCGSGRKYKVCHLGRERLDLIDRGPWLYAKARRYLATGRHADLGSELVRIMTAASGQGFELRGQLEHSPLLADLALCEGGAFMDFLAERSHLLPDDEALMAARWQLVERSLFEIEGLTDDSLRLRDLRTGDHIEVTNATADERSRDGMILLGRPLPIEDTWRAYPGFVLVPPHLVEHMLAALDEPEPNRLAALIGTTFALPTMRNTDGNDLVFHEVTWQVPDPAAARAALDASDLRDDGDGTYTLVRDSANQPDTIILVFRLEGDELRVSANSRERAAEARSIVERIVPAAVLTDEDVRDLDEVMRERADPEQRSTVEPDMDDPAMRETLERFVRDFEQRWMDGPVPALGGRTPRQAAEDPIGRHELERLLASFPEADGPGAMSPSRLREALGLPHP